MLFTIRAFPCLLRTAQSCLLQDTFSNEFATQPALEKAPYRDGIAEGFTGQH